MAKDFEHQEDNAVSGDFETEFHYPVGKLEEETVRDPHGGCLLYTSDAADDSTEV